MPRWIQDKETLELIPADEYYARVERRQGPLVVPDLPDHVSPVTGEVIHGRAGMREHMRRHNLAHADDFKNEWKQKAKEREAYFKGEDQRHRKDIRRDMVEALKRLER